MKTTIQFGDQVPITKQKMKRKEAKPPGLPKPPAAHMGLETNGHTTYASDVHFANIETKINVLNAKSEPTAVGVAKGGLLADVPAVVVQNTAGATAHAMKKRCDFAPTTCPDEEVIKKGHAAVMSKFDALPTIQVTAELISEYLATCTPAKAERLRKALTEPEIRYDGGSKHVFAKAEVLLKPHGAQPRVVYQGTDMYNAVIGALIMEITRRMKQVFSLSNPKNTGNKIVFACGMTNEEIGDMLDNSPGQALESDATNNDGSQSKTWRRYEAMFYGKLGAPVWFVREFARNTMVRVWTRFGLAAVVDGERWSGESTTTTGNSYVHMCNIQHSLEEAEIKESTNVHGGDDYLGVISEKVDALAGTIPTTFQKVGMEAKVVKPATREHATFYRKRYVRGLTCSRGVPQFGRVLSKLNLRANRNTEVDDRAYMAGKYLSAAYEHRYVPDLAHILVETANRLSDNPHFDDGKSKLREMGSKSEIIEKVTSVETLDRNNFEGFLQQVYGIGHQELLYAYKCVADSALEYAAKYTHVVKGKVKTKGIAPLQYFSSDVFKVLAKVDVL